MTQRVLQIGFDRWLDLGLWFISKVNYILDQLYFEVNEINTENRKYFQAQI